MWKNHRKRNRKPIIMKQIVETPNQPNVLCDLFNNIYFEFDKTEITPKAATIIDEIAQIMLTDTSKNISLQDVLMQKDHHNTIWNYPKTCRRCSQCTYKERSSQ